MPLPAFWRTNFERRGYLIQLYVYVNKYHLPEIKVSDALTQYFKNSSYYFMNIFQSSLTLTESNILLQQDKVLAKMINDLMDEI